MKNNSKILSGIILPFALLSSMLVPANSSVAEPTWTAPNDPKFGEQWNLSQLDIPKLWEKSTGQGQIVAVLDSGIVEHPDLEQNVLLSGYDMISDPNKAKDDNGRDNIPNDEGNYCEAENESSDWHGTHVAGIIASVKDNNIGIAGVAPNAKILPVRVLGECGEMSATDLVDAIVWSAGGKVDDIPMNHTPATVINASLDPERACSVELQDAIDFAVSRNIPVVTISGNHKNDSSISNPGNCQNVINVGASTFDKKMAVYSNLGDEVDIIAPGGGPDASNPTDITYYGILSTANSGIKTPDYPNNESSVGFYSKKPGTSQAAPLVAGVVAIMRSLNPSLTPAEIESLIQSSATLMQCVGCGAGMINPVKAVALVTPPPPIAPDVSITGYRADGYPRVWDTLTALSDKPWYPADTSLKYQWMKSGSDIFGATERTYVVQPNDIAHVLSVKVTGTNQGDKSTTVTSKETLKVSYDAKISPPSTSPYVEGVLASGNTLEAKLNGNWSPAPVDITYQWYRGGTDGSNPSIMIPLAGATSSSYKLSTHDEGKVLEVVISGNKHGYVPSTVKARTNSFVTTTDRIVASIPTIEGVYEVGQTLTARHNDWSPANMTYYYQWRIADSEDGREGTYWNMPIQNATGSTYTVTEADKGKIISVDVEAYLNGVGYSDTFSSEIRAENVIREKSFTASKPKIAGTPKINSVLTALPGEWGTGVALTYQWNANGLPITNATKSTYTVPVSDLTKTISVTVSGSLTGVNKSHTSDATLPVAKGSLITTPATITGTVKVGNRLTVNHAPWGPAPVAITYQWYRSGVLIPGATASSYMLTADDRGKIMTVHVTGRKTGYTAVYRKSAATVAVAYGDLKGSFPTLSGTPEVNNTLVASPGLWTAGVTVSYQWYRDGVLVTGASGRYYKLASADLGKQIKVRVLGKKTGYVSRAYYSLSTAKVVPFPPGGSYLFP